MITPEQKRFVRESYPEITALRGPVAKLFYGRLFEVAPEVRPMFKQDIAIQGRKLMDMLAALVAHLEDLEEMDPMLRSLGQRHTAYGVRSEHYDMVTAALLWAFSVALDAQFTPELRLAWQALIENVAATMKDGAAELISGSYRR